MGRDDQRGYSRREGGGGGEQRNRREERQPEQRCKFRRAWISISWNIFDKRKMIKRKKINILFRIKSNRIFFIMKWTVVRGTLDSQHHPLNLYPLNNVENFVVF